MHRLQTRSIQSTRPPPNSPFRGIVMNRTRKLATIARLALVLAVAGSSLLAAPATDFLKYQLLAQPGDLTVDQMPGPSPKTYQEEFTFKVSNPTRTDFNGKAPTTQTFDVEVFF